MADYEFYVSNFHGSLSEDDFARLSVRATAEVNRITYGRAAKASGTDLEAVSLAECAVVDELANMEKGGEIVSESNDGVSVSYASGTAQTKTQRIVAAAMVYLWNTDLCFAGV